MLSITSLLPKLRSDFSAYTFEPSDQFRWSPRAQTIYYDTEVSDPAQLLHELSHAILQHTTYQKDINLIEMERAAWEYAATTLSNRYKLTINQATIEDSLDSYRDWLHARSTCPSCKATGVQTQKSHYKCVACGTAWRVNDARICGLRRYTT